MAAKTIARSGRKKSLDEKAFISVGSVLLFAFAILCLIPFVIVISSSLSTESSIIRDGYGLWPKEFSLGSYQTIFKSPMQVFRAYGVTILVTLVGTGLSIFINTMTGYVLQRRDFAWRNKFSFYFFFTTLFSGGLVPWFIMCSKYLHLTDTIFALFVPTLVSVWNILLVKGFMTGIPYEISESAKIDGAGDFTTFCRIILPLSKPVIATIGLFTALNYWNDWYHSMLFINNENLYSLQYLLYRLVGNAQAMRKMAEESGQVIDTIPIESMKMALTVVVTGPIVLLYPFVQRYFVKGLTLGSVKG